MIALQKNDDEQERITEGEVLTGRRILVAEDGIDNQRLVRHFLESAGANVEIAGNGRIAVDRVSNDASFDAILMDVQMPEMDGHEATRRIREMRYRGPVIALTAHALNEEREAILAAGIAPKVAESAAQFFCSNLSEMQIRHAKHQVCWKTCTLNMG